MSGFQKHSSCNHIVIHLLLSLLFMPAALSAALGDADWNDVNETLRNRRNTAGTDATLHTQCSAAGICLEVSKWLYILGSEENYRQDLISKADEILNIPDFDNKPWSVHFGDIGITILATEDMAYLFRHIDTRYVFLDSIYFYDADLGGSVSDHTERQRLFIQPSTSSNRALWAAECRSSTGTDPSILLSSSALELSPPIIGGTNGVSAWVKFTWNNELVPGTTRRIRVEAKIEVYTGTQNLPGTSVADSTHGSWWIDVSHVSGFSSHLWSLEFPRLDKMEKFHRFPSDKSYFVLPKCGGVEFETGTFDDPDLAELPYPGGECHYQFVPHYQRNAGLIYYCDDKAGFRKMLKTEDNGSGTRIGFVHYPKMQGDDGAQINLTQSTDLNYACRIGVFKGDWYDAAVWIRKNWMSDAYADFLPETIRGRWLLDAHHGSYSWDTLKSAYDGWLDSALNTHFPGNQWLGSHSAYSWRPDFNPEPLTYNGQWIYEPIVEIVSQPGRDYVYDPIQGSHYNRINQLRADHNIKVLTYTAGRLMCKLFEDYGEYPDSPHYVQDGETWAVRNPDGSQPFIPRKISSNLVGKRGYVCPACSQWRDFIAGQMQQTTIRAESSSRYHGGVYLDVTCTRPTYGGPCYNTDPAHGHPNERGGGTHYTDGTISLINAVREGGSNGGENPDYVVVTEGTGDVFIKHLDSFISFQNDNDSYVSLPIGHILWADRIRPYADKYAGDIWSSQTGPSRVKTARAFVWGVGMGRIKEPVFADNGNQLRAIKRMVWYRRSFSQFLARGKMLRPPQTNYPQNEVLCATWKNGNDVLFAFANGTDTDKMVSATFNLADCDIQNPLAYKLYQVSEDGTYESDASAPDFPSEGMVNRSFILESLGENNGNQGVLCFIAKRVCQELNPDIFPNDTIDFLDFSVLSQFWLSINCGYMNGCCHGSDLNSDQHVDLKDIACLSLHWLN